MPRQTPVSVIGGFLGAGKTTLLNHVLQHAQGVRYAVLVNDFGKVAIDDRLVVEHGGDTIRFANGCLCCSLGDNLISTVDRLLGSSEPPDQFLIEASGVADPTAIADVATLHPDLQRDLVVVLCDATSVRQRAADERLADTLERQLAAADVLVMNHCDRASASEIATTLQWLQEQTGRKVIRAVRACIDINLLDASNNATGVARSAADDSTLEHPFYNEIVRGEVFGGIDGVMEALRAFGPGLVRAKGLLRSDERPARWWLVQKTGEFVECTLLGPEFEPAGHSEIVLLSLDPLPAAGVLSRALGISQDEESHASSAEPVISSLRL